MDSDLTYSQEVAVALDFVHAQIALVNRLGDILWVNNAWKEFGLNNGLNTTSDYGNYFEVCRNATGDGSDDATLVLMGFAQIFKANLKYFKHYYRCDSPTEDRYYHLEIFPSGINKSNVIVKHTDISELVYLEKRNETIKKELELRKLMLQESHHRIKNSLQLVTSVISLQKNSIDDEQSKTLLDQTITRIHTISLIHEKIYDLGKDAKINVKDYLSKLVDLYEKESANTNITFERTFQSLELNADLLNAIGMICSEIIINSMKYAFKNSNDENFIRVQSYFSESSYIIELSDNGVGFQPDKSKVGLGSQLIEALTEQYDIDLILKSEMEKGTQYRITIARSQVD